MARRILTFAPTRKGQRYTSPYDAQPPRYTGPDWIGKPAQPRYGTSQLELLIGKRFHASTPMPPSDKIGG